MTVDRLAPMERAAIAEEVASVLRHDLRNRHGAIRNALHYLRRKLEDSEPWRADPRLDKFLGLAVDELVAAGELLDGQLALSHLFARHVQLVPVLDALETAIRTARVPPDQPRELRAEPATVQADAHELALAVRCLVENAAEAAPGRALHVVGQPAGAEYKVDVVDAGPGMDDATADRALRAFFTTKPGHAGLGLNIARRVAARYGGKLTFARQEAGFAVSLALPGATTDAGG